jgi:sugar (pentulose or hexulose) kinase
MLAMTPGSVVQMDMQAKVSTASAADCLVDPTKFKKLSYTDIIKHVGVIKKHLPDVKLPANVARNITRKYAEQLLYKENWSA